MRFERRMKQLETKTEQKKTPYKVVKINPDGTCEYEGKIYQKKENLPDMTKDHAIFIRYSIVTRNEQTNKTHNEEK